MMDCAGRPPDVECLETMCNARLLHDDIGGVPGGHVPGNALVVHAIAPDFMRAFAWPQKDVTVCKQLGNHQVIVSLHACASMLSIPHCGCMRSLGV